MVELPGTANGGDLVAVNEVATTAGVSLTAVLAAVIHLGHQRELERLDGATFLRRWAADACVAHLAGERRVP